MNTLYNNQRIISARSIRTINQMGKTAEEAHEFRNVSVSEAYQLTSKNDDEIIVQKSKSTRFPKRYLITLLLFFGLINMHAMRVNLNIAIVEMTSNKTVTENNQTTIYKDAEFDWDSRTKGFVLSSFFYGFLVSTPMGGYFANKFGGVNTFGCGIFVTSVLTITTPVSLYLNFYWFAFCRVLEGVAEALSYTSTADIWSRWARPQERSKMVAFAFTGVYIGVAAAFPFCGHLIQRYGWPAAFYATGALGLAWFFIWVMLATNNPPADEIDRRSRVAAAPTVQVKFPWKSMLTSVPVWALFSAEFSYAWGYALMVQCFPLYIKDVTNTNVEDVGFISAIPNFVSIFTVPICGYLTDWIIRKKIMTVTNTHKTLMCTSLLASAILVIIVSHISDFTYIMVCFIFFKMSLSFTFIMLQLVPLYLSPRYSSGICGMTTFGYTFGSIVSPTFFGFVVTNHRVQEWNTFFTAVAIVSIVGAVIFAIFSSSELQSWSAEPTNDQYCDHNAMSEND